MPLTISSAALVAQKCTRRTPPAGKAAAPQPVHLRALGPCRSAISAPRHREPFGECGLVARVGPAELGAAASGRSPSSRPHSAAAEPAVARLNSRRCHATTPAPRAPNPAAEVPDPATPVPPCQPTPATKAKGGLSIAGHPEPTRAHRMVAASSTPLQQHTVAMADRRSSQIHLQGRRIRAWRPRIPARRPAVAPPRPKPHAPRGRSR